MFCAVKYNKLKGQMEKTPEITVSLIIATVYKHPVSEAPFFKKDFIIFK